MNKSLYLATFIAGAAIGSAATWFYTKTKYERIAQEEIDSVKKAFSKKNDNDTEMNNAEPEPIVEERNTAYEEAKQKAEAAREKPNMMEYATMLNEERYVDEETPKIKKTSKKKSKKIKEEEVKVVEERPYVISPDEFGEMDDYETISLTYFEDGVLTDDEYNIIEDIESMIGEDSLTHFGEYEDDSVFVRNDAAQCDYEILRDMRSYEDIMHSED